MLEFNIMSINHGISNNADYYECIVTDDMENRQNTWTEYSVEDIFSLLLSFYRCFHDMDRIQNYNSNTSIQFRLAAKSPQAIYTLLLFLN